MPDNTLPMIGGRLETPGVLSGRADAVVVSEEVKEEVTDATLLGERPSKSSQGLHVKLPFGGPPTGDTPDSFLDSIRELLHQHNRTPSTQYVVVMQGHGSGWWRGLDEAKVIATDQRPAEVLPLASTLQALPMSDVTMAEGMRGQESYHVTSEEEAIPPGWQNFFLNMEGKGDSWRVLKTEEVLGPQPPWESPQAAPSGEGWLIASRKPRPD